MPKKSARLYRPDKDRKIAGVCAGLAKYMDMDVVFIRVIFLLLLLPGGLPGLIPYIAFWLVMPEERDLLTK